MIRRNQRFLTQLYMVADFLIIQISFLAALWLKFKSGWLESYNTLPVESYAYWSLIYGVISVFIGIVLSCICRSVRNVLSMNSSKYFRCTSWQSLSCLA